MKTDRIPRITLRLAFALCSSLLNTGAGAETIPANRYAPVIERYTTLLQEEMGKMGVVGLGVALVDEHGVIWAQGFGSEDLEKNIPVSTNTLFGIGSMTKVFTAAAVMQLQGRHALDIDQPLSKSLPGFKIKSRFASAGPITPRRVLTHHAGIPQDIMATGDTEDFRSFLPVVADMHAAFAPDYVDSYSNLGFCILGNLVEAVTKDRYEAYVQDHIFKTCGMKVSRFNAEAADIPHVSRAYDDSKQLKADHYMALIPAGSIFSSLDDMTRFLQVWLNGGRAANGVLLDSKLVDEMFRIQNRDVALDLGHARGLCWDIEDGEAGRIYSHGGATLCFRSQMVIAPECGLAAVMLANTSSGGGVTWRTKELVKEAAQVRGVAMSGTRRSSDPLPKANIKPLAPEQIPGIYAADFMHMEISREGSNFLAKVSGQTLKFLPSGDGVYQGQYKEGDNFNDMTGEEFYFAEVGGHSLLLQKKWGSLNNGGCKIPLAEIPAAWQARVGKYHALRESKKNWFNDAELTIQDGILVLMVPLSVANATVPFQLLVDDSQMAHVPGMNRYSGNVIEFPSAGASKADMVFMGMQMKKM